MITIDRGFLEGNGLPNETLLLEILKVHEKIREQLQTLKDLYSRNHDITSRVRLSGLPNNKLVHDYPGYIVTIAAGYLVGKPVQYVSAEAIEGVFKPVGEALAAARPIVWTRSWRRMPLCTAKLWRSVTRIPMQSRRCHSSARCGLSWLMTIPCSTSRFSG